MKNLLLKEEYSKEDLEKLDRYFDENIEELVSYSNDVIIKFIDSCVDVLGYSLAKIDLDHYLFEESSDAKFFFDYENLDFYNKILELINYYKLNDYGLSYSIGDYFYHEKNYEEALKYYKKIFKNGFDLCKENYYYSLLNYLRLLNKNPKEELKELIKNSPKDNLYSLDFTNTYLLLIINLEKFSDEYLYYINEAIKVNMKVVRDYQKNNINRKSFSDTDEERNLCELLALKMEYYLNKKDYIKTFELYKELTYEILRSDCTRYYHARDKYYREMLNDMSIDYPELKFFIDIGYYKFKVNCNDFNFNVNDEIELEKEDGLTFKFKIVNIYNENNITIVPLLPLIGEGGKIPTLKTILDNKCYLVNQLSR